MGFVGEADQSCECSLKEAQTALHERLSDSFDTPSAITILVNIVSTANVYMTSRSRKETNVVVLHTVADWVTRILRIFGLGEGGEADGSGRRIIGWGQARSAGEAVAIAGGSGDREAILMPYLRTLSAFRDGVRNLAMKSDVKVSDILALCDQLRDHEMVDLGVALDDQEDGKALVKLVPAEQLRAARDEKAAAARDKADKKAASQAAAEKKRKDKLEKGRTPPAQLYRTDEYSKWDEEGLPTHDAKGEEVTKSKLKKLRKDYEQQQKLHEAFLADQQS